MSENIYDPQLAPFIENGEITQIGADGKRHPVSSETPEPEIAPEEDAGDEDGGEHGEDGDGEGDDTTKD